MTLEERIRKLEEELAWTRLELEKQKQFPGIPRTSNEEFPRTSRETEKLLNG